MAIGGRAEVTVYADDVLRMLNVVMRNVDRGTKAATLAACQDIYDRSQELVPRDTNTLSDSGFIYIAGKGSGFAGVVGYGGNGDPVNPKTFIKASKYMVQVHEDLTATHHIGQAKFLETAVREYQSKALGNAAGVLLAELR